MLAVAVALLAAGFVVAVATTGLVGTLNAIVLQLREAGPGVFFVAMALLPAAGFPLLAFTLAAGPVFAPSLGAGWVILWSLAAVVGNLLLTYWLADRAIRPLVTRLLAYFDYRLPEDLTASAWQLSLIVRLTPGPPFWLQSYVLGVVRVPLLPYLTVSTGVLAGYIVALVWGGEALASGNGRLALASLATLAVSVAISVAGLQLLRRRKLRRLAASAGP